MADMTVLDKFPLDGKVAIVSGASSGLGIAFAQGLAEAGADVALAAPRGRAGRHPRTRRGGRPAGGDARHGRGAPEGCHALVDATREVFGRVDILVQQRGQRHDGARDARDPEHAPDTFDDGRLRTGDVGRSTRRATCGSPAVPRTSSSPAASRSAPLSWRTCSWRTPMCWRPRSSVSPTRSGGAAAGLRGPPTRGRSVGRAAA